MVIEIQISFNESIEVIMSIKLGNANLKNFPIFYPMIGNGKVISSWSVSMFVRERGNGDLLNQGVKKDARDHPFQAPCFTDGETGDDKIRAPHFQALCNFYHLLQPAVYLLYGGQFCLEGSGGQFCLEGFCSQPSSSSISVCHGKTVSFFLDSQTFSGIAAQVGSRGRKMLSGVWPWYK